MIRTFLDAGVLIAATRMTGAMGVKAMALFTERSTSPLFRVSGLTITTLGPA